MTYANQTDIQWFWEQIDDFFARLTEAGGSIQFDGETLTLHAITGGQLGAGINLHYYFPKNNEAAGSMVFDSTNKKLQLKAVNGSDLGAAVDISGITSGLPTIQNTGRSLNLSGKRLELLNAGGGVLSYVNLP